MAYEVAVPNNPIPHALIVFSDQLNPDDLVIAIDDIHTLMDDLTQPVSTIIHFDEIVNPFVSILPTLPKVLRKIGHPMSTGIIVLVGVMRRRITANVFARLQSRVHFADTLNGAFEILGENETRPQE